ncbi:MAG: hypothetical protein D3906_07020 [Candidatus Electrothrix sp. AUS1_2]|nr:hypothetical protein [Candidatus Electrothrix sp. AUS1_2]
MSEKGGDWGKGIVFTIITLVIAILTLLATFTVPEIREFFGLEEAPVSPPPSVFPLPESQPALPAQEILPETPTSSAGSAKYTILNNQSQFIEQAQAILSVTFQNIEEQEFVRLTISPVGRETSVRAVLNGYTEEFASSTGIFLVQVMDVDYTDQKISVQVNRKKI